VRSRFLDDPDWEQEFKKTQAKVKSYKELAEKMRISRKTAIRYCKELGLSFPKGRPEGTHSFNKLSGGLAKWISEHPDQKLPRSPRAISAITGLTYDQVKCSLYRLKERHAKKIKSLGDLREYPGGFKSPNGDIVLFRDFTSYKIYSSPYNNLIKIEATLKNKRKVSLKLTLEKLLKIKNSLKK